MNNNNSTHNNPMTFLYYLGSELWQGLMQHKIMTLSGVLCALFLRIHLIDSLVAQLPFHLLFASMGYVIKGMLGAIGVMAVKKRFIYYEWIRAKVRYHYSKMFNKTDK